MRIFILQLWVMFGVWLLLDIILYSNSHEIFNRNMTCNAHCAIFLVFATLLALFNKWMGW